MNTRCVCIDDVGCCIEMKALSSWITVFFFLKFLFAVALGRLKMLAISLVVYPFEFYAFMLTLQGI